MKIAYLGNLNENLILSGPEKYSKMIFQHVPNYVEKVFIQYYFKSCKDRSLYNIFLGNQIVSKNPLILRMGIIKVFLYLRMFKPVIVHVLSAERFTIPVYIFKFLLNCKIVTTFHSVLKYEIPRDAVHKNNLGRFKDYLWEWLAVKVSDRMIFLSKQHLDLASKYYDLNQSKITIIPNGVEKEFYDVKKDFVIYKKLNIIFYNGIYDSIDRDIEQVIKILNEINNSSFKMFIIGKEIILNDINFEIEFVKPMNKNDLISFLKDKHILIKSTSYDSFSIFTLECMSAGLVAVVSDNIGISSFIHTNINGFVYRHNRPEVMKEILENIVNGKFNLESISKEAKKIYYELNWQKISELYVNFYKSSK
jgi:glycosyltransferase involved in cell wall biosynthesis